MIIVDISLRNRRAQRARDKDRRQHGQRIGNGPNTAAHIRAHCVALTNYLRDADPRTLPSLGLADDAEHRMLTYIVDQAHSDRSETGAGEKVDFVGFRNLTPMFEKAQAEMLALIGKARGGDPIVHYVVSWQESERPSPEQVGEAIDVLLRMLNLQDHQSLYATHDNTGRYHAHLAVNRVHPETHRLTAAGDGWQLNAAQQAAALIEHRQGWVPEQNAQYVADDDGVRHRDSARHVRFADATATGVHPPDQRAADKAVNERLSTSARRYEDRTGRESFERIAMTVAAPIIARARSWDELHGDLADEGLEYRPYGTNGARIRMGERAIPASVAARNAAITQLSQPGRLGPFMAGDPERVRVRATRYLPGQDRRPAYEAALATHTAAIAAANAHITDARARAREVITAWRQSFTTEINGVDWRGRGEQLNATRQLFAGHFQTIEFALMAAAGPALSRLSASRFPSYAAWSVGAPAPDIPSTADAGIPVLAAPTGDHGVPGTFIAGYERQLLDRVCAYRRAGSDPAFVDRGPVITIHTLDRADVTAALMLAQAKFGDVELLSGSDAFVKLAVEIAEQEKIVITGRLAERYKAAGARLAQPQPALPSRLAELVPTRPSPATQQTPALPLVPAPPPAPAVRSPEPVALLASDEMRGSHARIDAWLEAWQRDPDAMTVLRPLAAAVTADRQARAHLDEWLAEGLPAAARILQHAADHARMLAGMQARTRKLAPRRR